MSRRYRVLHRTSYSYDDVVTNSYGRAYLTPRDIAGQQRLHRHRVKVEPAPTDEAQSPDVYGNLSSYFQVTSEHWELVVTSESVVEVQAPAPGRLTEGAALRPWEEARPTAADGARQDRGGGQQGEAQGAGVARAWRHGRRVAPRAQAGNRDSSG